MNTAPIRHTIKAYLYDNPLTLVPGDFNARTVNIRSLNIKQICLAAAERGGADISMEAMQYAAELFFKEMAHQLCNGFSVNTGYFTAGAGIRGIFKSASETFDPARHSLVFRFTQGEKLRAEIPGIRVEILGPAKNPAFISAVQDMKSGIWDTGITPGGILKIKGRQIRLAGDLPGNGIFFINTTGDPAAMAYRGELISNNPSEIICTVPLLPAGLYRIEIITQYAGSTLLKKPRTAAADKLFTVI